MARNKDNTTQKTTPFFLPTQNGNDKGQISGDQISSIIAEDFNGHGDVWTSIITTAGRQTWIPASNATVKEIFRRHGYHIYEPSDLREIDAQLGEPKAQP